MTSVWNVASVTSMRHAVTLPAAATVHTMRATSRSDTVGAAWNPRSAVTAEQAHPAASMSRRSPRGWRPTSPAPRRRSTFDLIAGGHSNLTYRVVGADGHPLVLRRPPLGHLLASAHDMGREHRIIAALAGTAVPVAPALGLLRRRRRERRAVLRHGLRRRPRHPRPRRGRGRADPGAAPPGRRAPRRHARRHPRRRHRRGRALRPRPPRGLHRPPAQALVRAVAAVADPAAARPSTRSTTCSPPASPSRARRASCTATTGSTTRMVDDDGARRSPCSTGRSAPSATPWPTSGC